MKKALLIIFTIIYSHTIIAQSIPLPLLKKSKTYVLAMVHKNKNLHQIGFTTAEDMAYNKTLVDSPFVNEVWYHETFYPKGFYAFDISCTHDFDENNICIKYTITVPSGYMKYIMAHLQGYKQLGGNRFRSYDEKTTMELDDDSDNGNYILVFWPTI